MLMTFLICSCSYKAIENAKVGEVDTNEANQTQVENLPSGPEAIDLGLPSGTKWANMNVGATKPEDYGGYYAWGETEEKTIYNHVHYMYCTGKDIDDDGEYDEDEKYQDLGADISGTEYDVAHVKWGGDWRMPTINQIEELIQHCSITWTDLNGVKGLRLTSKINGNSIFLPATGFCWGNRPYQVDCEGSYWSSTQDPSYMFNAHHLFFFNTKAQSRRSIRPSGLSVRPVK